MARRKKKPPVDAKKRLLQVRSNLLLGHPFFGSLSFKLDFVEDPSCKSTWTDGVRLGYNPLFISRLSFDEVKGVFCHEIMHCVLSHHLREGDRVHERWNRACDYVINSTLIESGFVLPLGALLDAKFADMSADKVYSLLPEETYGNGDGNGDDDGNSGNGDGDGNSDSDGNNSNSNSNGNGNNGAPCGCGEVRAPEKENGKPLSPSETKQMIKEWKVAAHQAIQASKLAGNLPKGLERFIRKSLLPSVNWKQVLHRFVNQSARNDYSWFPPNKRYVYRGFYLPSLKSEELPPVVLVVDTSGSVGQKELDRFASELTSVLMEHRTSCTVIYCDSKIANVEEFSSDDLPLNLHPKGGGGTNFRPAFDWVEEHGDTPSCLIYFTDLYCDSFPDYIPDYPVLWAHIPDSDNSGDNPEVPFGEIIEIENND